MSENANGRMRRGRGAALLLSALAAVGFDLPTDVDATAPAPGRYLVATERIRGGFFGESVVYLVSYGETGALGLVVNRPTDVALEEVVQGAAEGSGTLHLGGPVGPENVWMLLRAEKAPERGMRVADDVVVTSDAETLLEYARSSDTGRFRVYAGHAGWAPRQLDGEIARGQWLVVDAPSGAIFEEEPASLWKKLFRRHHRLVARR